MYQRPSKASIASGTRRNYNPTYLPSPPSSPYSQQQRRRLRSRFCWFSGMRGRREIILSLLICISVGFFLMQGIFWTTHIFFSPTSHDLIIPIPPEHDNLPLLFIGGSDGSGTRAFVRVLQQLGVVVTYDDATTFDVHGAEMFQKQGWPGLVNNVLRITHSGNYNFTDLPLDTQLICEREVAQFMKRKFRSYKRKTQLMQQQQHSHSFWNSRPPFPPIVTEVSFAMKAPVSMLVLPVLTKVAGKIKFLHVLRE